MLLSAIIISLGSLIGLATLPISKNKKEKAMITLVASSAGTMLGSAFFHLIPESVELQNLDLSLLLVLISFCSFYVLEKFLFWHHCHKSDCKDKNKHTLAIMNIFGDSIHNFLDGIIIVGAYMSSINLGLITSFTVALHEIPQEISDFGVLVYSGFSKRKAIITNLFSSFTTIIAVILGYFLINYSDLIKHSIIPFVAGGFLYIGASDLIPELKNESKLFNSFLNFLAFLFGIMLMYLLS